VRDLSGQNKALVTFLISIRFHSGYDNLGSIFNIHHRKKVNSDTIYESIRSRSYLNKKRQSQVFENSAFKFLLALIWSRNELNSFEKNFLKNNYLLNYLKFKDLTCLKKIIGDPVSMVFKCRTQFLMTKEVPNLLLGPPNLQYLCMERSSQSRCHFHFK